MSGDATVLDFGRLLREAVPLDETLRERAALLYREAARALDAGNHERALALATVSIAVQLQRISEQLAPPERLEATR